MKTMPGRSRRNLGRPWAPTKKRKKRKNRKGKVYSGSSSMDRRLVGSTGECIIRAVDYAWIASCFNVAQPSSVMWGRMRRSMEQQLHTLAVWSAFCTGCGESITDSDRNANVCHNRMCHYGWYDFPGKWECFCALLCRSHTLCYLYAALTSSSEMRLKKEQNKLVV